LYANPVVQKSQAKHGYPYIYPFVYDVSHGLIKHLDIDLKAVINK
ncbi:unnamed protein product, partial [Discosporangium mesarthrocarpum]